MIIFLSYPSKERALAEEVQLALTGAGHEVFFDRESLPAGDEYHAQIKAAVDRADLFVVLITPDSVAQGSYVLTEMGYARAKWPHPKGKVLPVLARPTPIETIPAYLRSVTLFQASGNLAAEVVDQVARRGGGKWLGRGLVGAAAAVALAALATFAPGLLKSSGDSVAPAVAGVAVPESLELRFDYKPAAAQASVPVGILRLDLQTDACITAGVNLAPQPDGYYLFPICHYPKEREDVHGSLTRAISESTQGGAPPPARFCLRRPRPLQPFEQRYVHLDCAEGKPGDACQLHFPSPKWLEPCAPETVRTSNTFSLFPVALAATADQRWAVPSVRTWAARRDALKGVGYTVFTIETDVFRDPAVIGVEFDVRVNGTPVYEDGLPPEMRPLPNDPARPLRFEFALESLDFQGAHAGCEAIQLSLRPRRAGGQGRGDAIQTTLAYVALRDGSEQSLAFGKGKLSWSARYIVPQAEWSHEAFITSVSYPAAAGDAEVARTRLRAVDLKQQFDRLELSYEGRPLVAVIRPPLTLSGGTLAYGLTVGVVPPSGQVRFTFSNAMAQALADDLLAQRASIPAARKVIDPGKYVYKAAGNAQRRETPTPPGVCGPVGPG